MCECTRVLQSCWVRLPSQISLQFPYGSREVTGNTRISGPPGINKGLSSIKREGKMGRQLKHLQSQGDLMWELVSAVNMRKNNLRHRATINICVRFCQVIADMSNLSFQVV